MIFRYPLFSQKWLIALFYLSINSLSAQTDTIQIPAINIQATRIPTLARRQPFAVSTYQADELQATRQQLSLKEYLDQLPGLFLLNANNYAQDLRISIRGFGARSAFGIRGIKIVVDGIPETTPDGQGQIDNLNIGMINRIEVLKGPAAALYGNASGGVIQIYSKTDFSKNFLNAGITVGSFSMQQYQLNSGWKNKDTRLIFRGAHTRSNGFREQSQLENTNLNLQWLQKLSERAKVQLQTNFTTSPIGDDPGGLNAEEVNLDRQMARDRNVAFQTGEAIQQFKLGGKYELAIDKNQELNIYGFYNHRNFTGRLPFEFGGLVALNRNYGGQGGFYKWKKNIENGINIFQIGYDLAMQADDRQRYKNLAGVKGDLTLDQKEIFGNAAIYVLDHLRYKKWLFVAGLRLDWNQIEIKDQRLIDGDQSGARNLSAINPGLGVNFELLKQQHIYGNFRTGFETPTLSELSANPNGAGGFNSTLNPQRSTNYELGFKGLMFKKLDVDIALFFIQTKADLVPYEIADFPDRSFYRNAGRSDRKGVEIALNYTISPRLKVQTSYTYSDFVYKDYLLPTGDFSKNQLPGIPAQQAQLSFQYQHKNGFNFQFQHQVFGSFYAEDANQVEIPAYQITNASLGFRWQLKQQLLIPFLGVNNLFSTKYYDNIRLNAFGNRFYEPAAGVNIYGGVRWSIE